MEDPFKLYKNALKSQYETEKDGVFAHLLAHPSQGNLRDLCIERCNSGSASDRRIFRSFLDFEFEHRTRQQMNDAREKFRRLTNFLKGSSDLSDVAGADMLALLLDFPDRPYNAYRRKVSDSHSSGTKKSVKDNAPTEPNIEVTGRKRKIYAVFLILPVVALVLYFLLSDPEKCLQWRSDHFESVTCDSPGELQAYDEELLKMRRISVDKNTKFFIDEEPNVWYLRADGKIEYFNMPGKHPVTGKQLLPISTPLARRIVMTSN